MSLLFIVDDLSEFNRLKEIFAELTSLSVILVRLGVLDSILFCSRKAFSSKRDALACLEHWKSDGNSSKVPFLQSLLGNLGGSVFSEDEN